MSVTATNTPPTPPFSCPRLPVTRGSVVRFGLGFSGGFRSGDMVRFLLALDRISCGTVLPVSGSFWMNFFSTYFERIHDSFSALWGGGGRRRTGRRSRGGTSCQLLRNNG